MINRIEELKKYLGLSTRAMAIKCGLNQPTLDRMLKGINALNLNCVSNILSAFPQVSAEWLMRGKGEMILSESQDNGKLERLSSLIDTISLLQDTINTKSDTIARLNERIKQLEAQIKK